MKTFPGIQSLANCFFCSHDDTPHQGTSLEPIRVIADVFDVTMNRSGRLRRRGVLTITKSRGGYDMQRHPSRVANYCGSSLSCYGLVVEKAKTIEATRRGYTAHAVGRLHHSSDHKASTAPTSNFFGLPSGRVNQLLHSTSALPI